LNERKQQNLVARSHRIFRPASFFVGSNFRTFHYYCYSNSIIKVIQMRDKIIELMARELCRSDGYNPDDLEPGNCPYHNDTEIVDSVVRGVPHFFMWRLFRYDAERAFTALEAAGYKFAGPDEVVVPREPTEKMIEACHAVINGSIITRYRAMITASQKPRE
jgi:hypothetical protein